MIVIVKMILNAHNKIFRTDASSKAIFLNFAIFYPGGAKCKVEILHVYFNFVSIFQKQPFRGVLRKKCSENMQQNYRRTPMPNFDFNKVALQLFREVLINYSVH